MITAGSVVAVTAMMLATVPAHFSAKIGRIETNSSSTRFPRIVPSSLFADLIEKRSKEPRLSSARLVEYANQIVKEKGINYEFDLCEIVAANKHPRQVPGKSPETKLYVYALTGIDGRSTTFEIVSEDLGGPCAYCYFAFPCLRVTKQELMVTSEGKRYHLKRTAKFSLYVMSLVDKSMKTTIRSWEVPYESYPVGISQDGTRIFIGTPLEELVLGISAQGPQFQASAFPEPHEREWLTEHPKDPKNDALSFMRFRNGNTSYIVRFTAPCT
jgi:hypothetical protein